MSAKSIALKSAKKKAAPAPVAATPETKGGRTRAAIIDAAYSLFLSKGYHGTSMREIAEEANLALGGIYNHFTNKEEIFVAMLAERHPFLRIIPALQGAVGNTVEDLVCDAATRMIDTLGKSHDVVNLMFIEQVEFNGKHVAQIVKPYYPALKEFVQRLSQLRGPLRPIPPFVLLRAFIGLFYSYFMTETLIIERLPAHADQSAFDYFVEIYLHGVVAEG